MSRIVPMHTEQYEITVLIHISVENISNLHRIMTMSSENKSCNKDQVFFLGKLHSTLNVFLSYVMSSRIESLFISWLGFIIIARPVNTITHYCSYRALDVMKQVRKKLLLTRTEHKIPQIRQRLHTLVVFDSTFLGLNRLVTFVFRLHKVMIADGVFERSGKDCKKAPKDLH